MQWKTISLQEYEYLIKLVPQAKSLKNTIHGMESAIKSKDLRLEELQAAYQREMKDCINISHLSDVSVYLDT